VTLRPISDILHDAYMVSERASEDFCDERVDGAGRSLYLDNAVSMSALDRDRAADAFYGVQQDLFSEGDPHGL